MTEVYPANIIPNAPSISLAYGNDMTDKKNGQYKANIETDYAGNR
ncbi:MAG TPA: hypothetical protein VKA92_10070 [Segetibacter sp.]|nr:hypothetical protein [Segetibacter sp.]